MAWPSSLEPQHSTEPSVFTPHVWNKPALTEAKAPPGGVAWPSSLSPQHSTEPSVLARHVCKAPALTAAKAFVGDWAEPSVDSTVSVGAEVGVLVGTGAVAVGSNAAPPEGVSVGVGVAIWVAVAVGVAVGTDMGVGVDVAVAVCSGVGADESLQALRTTAMASTRQDCEPADTKK